MVTNLHLRDRAFEGLVLVLINDAELEAEEGEMLEAGVQVLHRFQSIQSFVVTCVDYHCPENKVLSNVLSSRTNERHTVYTKQPCDNLLHG
jgi:hypothetical protein